MEALAKETFEISLVITNPDRPKGRGRQLHPSPVKEAAQRLSLPVAHDLADLEATLERPDIADIAVVVAYGQIIPKHLLTKLPFINLHFSLLPKWRGAAPLERAILAGDTRTGICLMALEPTLDTGPIYSQTEREIAPHETLEELRQRLAIDAADLLVAALKEGLREPTPQQGDPTWAKKITTEDRHLNWSLTADHLNRIIRIGGAWTTFRNKRFLIWKAAPTPEPALSVKQGELLWEADSGRLLTGAGDGTSLEISEVQPEGKSRMSAKAWVNGANLLPGEQLA